MISGLDVFRPGTGWLVPLQGKVILVAGSIAERETAPQGDFNGLSLSKPPCQPRLFVWVAASITFNPCKNKATYKFTLNNFWCRGELFFLKW